MDAEDAKYVIRGKNRGGEGQSRDTVAPLFRLQWRLFAFFQLDTVVTTLTSYHPSLPPVFCSLSAIVLVRLRSPFLYVHVCYIHLGSFPAVRPTLGGPPIYIPGRVALDRTYLRPVYRAAQISRPCAGLISRGRCLCPI